VQQQPASSPVYAPSASTSAQASSDDRVAALSAAPVSCSSAASTASTQVPQSGDHAAASSPAWGSAAAIAASTITASAETSAFLTSSMVLPPLVCLGCTCVHKDNVSEPRVVAAEHFVTFFQTCVTYGKCFIARNAKKEIEVIMFVTTADAPKTYDAAVVGFSVCRLSQASSFFSDSVITLPTTNARNAFKFCSIDLVTTHSLCGLPPERPADAIGKAVNDTILEYVRSPTDVGTIRASDLYRLMYGGWISGQLIDFYACILQNAAVSNGAPCYPVRVESHTFFQKLHAEIELKKPDYHAELARYTRKESYYARVAYPCFLDSHWYLCVFDVPQPNGPRENGRLIILDPLKIFAPEVTNHTLGWLDHRGFKNLSVAFLVSGKQGENSTECGIFLLASLQDILQLPQFFDVKRLNSSRSVADCKEFRKQIAHSLREHIIRWLRDGTPIALNEDRKSNSPAPSPRRKKSKKSQSVPEEDVVVLEDSDSSPMVRLTRLTITRHTITCSTITHHTSCPPPMRCQSHVTPSHVTPSHVTPSHVHQSHVTPSHVTPAAACRQFRRSRQGCCSRTECSDAVRPSEEVRRCPQGRYPRCCHRGC